MSNIKNKKLRILTEFGNEENKSLLIELDKALSDQLDIDENGMVDTLDFINICLMELSKNMTAAKSVDLQRLIFDTSIAVDTRKRQ